jgi:hypothetical protein
MDVIDLSLYRQQIEKTGQRTHTLLCASVFPPGCSPLIVDLCKPRADRIYRIEPYEEQIDEDHT